jgi:nitrogen fixation NifU-like protein
MLDQLYRQLVMDHYKHPRHYGRLDNPGIIRIPYKNPTCGDAIVLYADIVDDAIANIRFEGAGCSISMASCSMMTSLVGGQSITEAQQLMNEFNQMIRNGVVPRTERLGDALALESVHAWKGRHNCALMGWQALELSLQFYDKQKELLYANKRSQADTAEQSRTPSAFRLR